ncbi:glycosyltransferase family 2 protein [Paucilactobacillus oligofermentans]|nr:glycosyltransferase [Paucilactobacillus oligofermentans]
MAEGILQTEGVSMLISIIVPVFNGDKFIKTCLDSVYSESNSNFEYIIVNDGSTDDTGDILREFKDTHDNVYIITQKNQGLSVARNSGLKVAKGDWMYFVDSDDFLDSGFIEYIYSSIREIPNDIKLLSLPVAEINRGTKKILQNPIISTTITTEEFAKLLIQGKRQFGVWSFVFKKEFLDEIDLLFLPGKICEDQYFVPIALTNTSFIYCLSSNGNFFYNYSFNPKSITRSKRTNDKIKQQYEAEQTRNKIFYNNFSELSTIIRNNMLTVDFGALRGFYKLNNVIMVRKLKMKIRKENSIASLIFDYKLLIKYIFSQMPFMLKIFDR